MTRSIGQRAPEAFTLVELIVVVTILALLSTIGFVSYSSYLSGVRDTNRVSQLAAISDGIELYSIKKTLPIPDDNIEIRANGTVIGYQGYAGINVLETIDYSKIGKDPKDKTYFSYYLTQDKKYYQMLTLLEDEDNLEGRLKIEDKRQNILIPKAEASIDYTNRYPKVIGKKLGILLDEENTPVQEVTELISSGYLDVYNNSDIFNLNFTDQEKYTLSGSLLFSYIYNSNKYLLGNKSLGSLDDSLVGHWDMETTTSSTILKDMSQYGHDGTIVGSQIIGGEKGLLGKATNLNGGIVVAPFTDLKSTDLTINVIFKASTLNKTSSEKVWNKPYIGVNNYYYSIIGQWDCTPTPPSSVSTCNDKGPAWWLGTHDQLISPTYTGISRDNNGSLYNPIITENLGTTKTNELFNRSVLDGEWYVVTFVKTNDNELKIFFNGNKQIDIDTYTGGLLESDLSLYIGTSGHTLNHNIGIGIFDDVRIYNRAFSDVEVSRLVKEMRK